MGEMSILLVTYPASGDYVSLCKKLVEDGLAACINIAKVRSIYYWEGKVTEDEEVLMVIKTDQSVAERLKEVIKKEHPYTVPEIVEISPVDVHKPYLDWVTASTVYRGR